MAGAARLVKASMEELWKAFSEPSAEMPRDSRRSIAGSSASNCLTTSTCTTIHGHNVELTF